MTKHTPSHTFRNYLAYGMPPPHWPERPRHRGKRSRSIAEWRAAQPKDQPLTFGIHPSIIKIALAVTVVFLAVLWLTFAWTGEISFLLVVATVFSLVFFGAFLLTCSYILGDPRWRQRETDLSRYLREEIDIATGKVPGRDVAIQILLLPVALTFAALAIGLAWAVLH